MYENEDVAIQTTQKRKPNTSKDPPKWHIPATAPELQAPPN